ncbi:mannose-1-phosphate guanylyltransferase [Thalassiella azotivora]
MTVDGFYALVPAGGAGTRLWPLSRAGAPKFLHDLTGTGRSLLQSTWDRLVPLAGPKRLLVVTGAAHGDAVRAQLPQLPTVNLLLEPSPRESMAAIGLAAAVVLARDPEAVVGSFAADHSIGDDEAFAASVRQAVATARAGAVVTIGITPTHPATGFGYVRPGAPMQADGAPDALRVEEFVEKPDAATAAGYVEAGYLWNAGMFVSRADVLLDHLRTHQSSLHEGVTTIADAWGTPDYDEVMARTWPGLTRIAIDHAIAEPVAATGGVAVVPGDFGWDDVGDWRSLAGLLPAGTTVAGGADGVQVLGDPGQVVAQDASGLVVPTAGRMVAVLGLQDVVVVDTQDAVLVSTRSRAQEVKGLVAALKGAGRVDLT